MQFTPHEVNVLDISDEISKLTGIKNIHHVHFWQLNDKDLFFEAHIDLEKDIRITEFQIILAKIEKLLAESSITHFNIQPEYSRDDGKDLIIQH